MAQLKHSFSDLVKRCLETGDVVLLDNRAMLDESPESIGARLAQAMDRKDVTPTQLADACNVSVAAIGAWIKTGKISREKIVPAARAVGRTIDWLLTGVEPRIIAGVPYDFVPRYNVRPHGGAGGQAPEVEQVESLVAFRADWLRSRGFHSNKLAVVPVRGDSMSPLINEGDIILVDREAAEAPIQHGRIYCINYDGDVRVKRLFRGLDGSLTISSDNKAAPENRDEIVPPGKLEALLVGIIGRVVWVGGEL